MLVSRSVPQCNEKGKTHGCRWESQATWKCHSPPAGDSSSRTLRSPCFRYFPGNHGGIGKKAHHIRRILAQTIDIHVYAYLTSEEPLGCSKPAYLFSQYLPFGFTNAWSPTPRQTGVEMGTVSPSGPPKECHEIQTLLRNPPSAASQHHACAFWVMTWQRQDRPMNVVVCSAEMLCCLFVLAASYSLIGASDGEIYTLAFKDIKEWLTWSTIWFFGKNIEQ